MLPKVSSSRKPVTRKTRNTTKKSTQIEPDRSRSPSVEPQSRETYNEIQQNQRNTQIHDSPNYNSIGSSAHSPFDANIYQHKAPLQMNRRSTNSFEDESSLPLQMNEDKSSEDEIFSSFGQNYNSNPLKKLSYSNIQSNMQNVNSYLDIQLGLTTSSIKNGLFFQDETHLIRWLEVRKDIVLQVLTSICSSPSIISNQVSSNSTPNLAKILSEQSRILFLQTRVPIKRTCTSLIKRVKALEALVARSLKIHVEYLILESKGADSDYTSTVLNHIKRLDNITINATFPAASCFQYANQLDLNKEQESNELNNSLGISNQQFKLNCKIDDDQQSYYRSIDQEDSNQDISSCNLYDTDNMEFDQEFDNNLDYGNLESIYENEFSDNINSDSLDDEYEPISNNIDDKPKTFDRTKPDINWNHESPYGLFGNFTNMAIFIWATNYCGISGLNPNFASSSI
ncbi:hypothetical protein C2G38_2201035 [Gigaspora rosea]|uniref:Uncharacterized protein n=1 Tax=Gigaspora rosea TaxID=44941 RepID=A0A397UU88_9GLOM|nr:hypothetical protein C2G38_2201035 [Gigaspora rosea]